MDQQNPFGTDSTPQFATAEYKSTAGEVCKSCNQPISGTYYRVNGALACDRCFGELKGQLPRDTHANFVRGIVFGIGGAILGLILYSVFGIVTGMVLGLVSLAVGYIVGKAIKTGSSGIGGHLPVGQRSQTKAGSCCKFHTHGLHERHRKARRQ
jgi:hypothetical protein